MIWVLLLLCALGLVLLWRTPQCPPPQHESCPPPQLSVIIPARNEARNLPPLLQSLTSQEPPPAEIIVVDDDSTDRTPRIAEEFGAKLIKAPELPEGWRGKTWACHQGAAAARGNVLLFLDADTRLMPGALARMQAACSPPYRVLSLGPYHEVQHPYEQLSAIFNLLTFMGMGVFGLFGSPSKPQGLFGPFLLIEREAYERVGGHAAVRGEILEHMSLCRQISAESIPMRCLNGRGVVHVRMYPDGLQSLWEGWTKAFAAGASKTSGLTLLLTVLWLTGGMLAFIAAVLVPLFPTHLTTVHLVPYLAYAVSLHMMLHRIGRFRWWTSLLYPVLFITFFAIFGRSALLRRKGGAVTWKGRAITSTEGPQTS